MRPVHTIPNEGTLREITIWKAIVLSIVTFGIYYAVVVYQHSKDLNATKKEPSNIWMVLFWLGFITGLVTWIVLYVLNGIAFKEMRERTGQPENSMWIVALVLALIVPPIGQIIWAAHFNDGLRTAASGTAGATTQAPMAQAA